MTLSNVHLNTPVNDQASDQEQHFVRPEALAGVFDALPLVGRSVLELGAGTGNLTRALLAQGVAHVEAWEIDPRLSPVVDPRVTWCIRDITTLSIEDLQGRTLVAFPPYSLLPTIEALLQDSTGDRVLMIPTRRLSLYQERGWRCLATLSGADFIPMSRGEHPIVVQGFRDR